PCLDQWEQLEPGVLYKLFYENQNEQEVSDTTDDALMHPDEETTVSACFSTKVKVFGIYILMENMSVFI
ncbi:MAG: hypothetical protein ACRC4N_18130, partial [Gammaproteobacteria bacterium]